MVQPESPNSSTRATITLSGNTYYGHHLIKAHLKEFVYLIGVRAPDPCRVKSSPPRFVPNSTDGGYSNVVKTTFNAKGIFAHWRKAYHYVIGSVVFSKNIPGAQRDQSRKVLLKKFNFRIDKRKRRVFPSTFLRYSRKEKETWYWEEWKSWSRWVIHSDSPPGVKLRLWLIRVSSPK